MKGFRKFIKQSWRFYLIALIIVLFFMVCDSVYICRDENIAFTGKDLEQQITAELEKAEKEQQSALPILEQGTDLCNVITDKAENAEIMGFIITIFGIMIILAARRYYCMDFRAIEFIRTLPVKQSSLVVYDYLSMLAVIVIGGLVKAGILLGYQSRYNHTLIKILEQKAVVAGRDNIVSLHNDRLLLYMGIYFLFLLLAYTWIYLGMTVTKNPIAGEIISGFIWLGICYIKEFLEWNMYTYRENSYPAGVEISPNYFLNGLNMEMGTIAGYSMGIMVGVVGIALLLGFCLLLMVSGKREPSKGKLFYFPMLDYPFALFCGFFLFIWLWDGFLYKNGPAGLAVGMIAAVMIGMLIHPASKKKLAGWEVK